MSDNMNKALADALAYGTGVMHKSDYVAYGDVHLAPHEVVIEAQAAEIERLQYLNDLNAVPAAIIEDRGRAEERAKIVAYLRSASNGSETVKYGNLFADEIEAGEHLK